MGDSNRYSAEELTYLRAFIDGLGEKERRHFLALQYKRLGKGSQRYLAEVFSCSRITITRGCRELKLGLADGLDYSRQRRRGGGRKKKS